MGWLLADFGYASKIGAKRRKQAGAAFLKKSSKKLLSV
jgi:hypothetical protein